MPDQAQSPLCAPYAHLPSLLTTTTPGSAESVSTAIHPAPNSMHQGDPSISCMIHPRQPGSIPEPDITRNRFASSDLAPSLPSVPDVSWRSHRPIFGTRLPRRNPSDGAAAHASRPWFTAPAGHPAPPHIALPHTSPPTSARCDPQTHHRTHHSVLCHSPAVTPFSAHHRALARTHPTHHLPRPPPSR